MTPTDPNPAREADGRAGREAWQQVADFLDRFPHETWASTGGEAAEHIRKHLLGAGRSDADAKHRDLTSRLGFGDNIAEPMADNDTIVGPTMAASDGHSDIRGQAIEAAAEAHYNYEAASLRPWEEQSNEARELWRTDVRVIVDAVLAVAGPAYRAEALREAAEMSRDLANSWGNDAAWMTTGTKVADLWASVLSDRADAEGADHA